MIRNPLHFMWIAYSTAVTIIGIYILYGQKYVPRFLSKIYKFGKTNKDNASSPYFVQILEVPKRWFEHFYIFASIFFLSIVMAVWRRYFVFHSSTFMIHLLDTYTDVNRNASVPPEAVIITSFLLMLHVWRRFYECHFVSVYSDAKMNVVHYIMGLTYYFGVGLSLISDVPGFLHDDDLNNIKFSSTWFSWNYVLGVMGFLFGFILQYRTNIQLANLRKGKDGKKVVTLGHLMPTGSFFELVSCPHYFAEIVMYLSAGIIMQSTTWWLLCLFVVSNQIIAGLLTHRWYQSYFKNYPVSRKAIIPYLI